MKRWSMKTMSNSSRTRADTASPRRSECCSIASRNCGSIRTTGLSEFMLLWKTVDRSRHRIARSSSWSRWVRSVPSNVIDPPLIRPGFSSSRSSAVARVVLPDPDSPIRPTNSPGAMSKLTSRTAVSDLLALGS